jgi:hypothetical protein
MMISTQHNNARLNGTISFADLGVSNASIQFYDSEQPALGGDGGAPLVEIILNKPCGTVVANALVLSALVAGGTFIESTGVVIWARWLNGNGDVVADGTVTDAAGNGDFRVAGTEGTTLYAGAYARLGVTALG